MRSKLSLRNFAIFVALVAVTFMIGLYGTMNKSRTDGANGAISLEAPLFISVAEAAETGITAFPADKAGISAYVKLSTPIDIDKVRTIFTKVVDVGDNYIIGIVPIPNPLYTTELHLYADTDGWFVAYLTREEPAAKIMKWPGNFSQITKITTTTLQEALRNAGQAAGVGVPRGIKYYDFKFPDATVMTLFVMKGLSGRENPPAIMQVKIPADYVLYEASYFLHQSGSNRGSRLYVDEADIDGVYSFSTYGMTYNSYKGAITVGTLHTIKVSGGAATATVLIYRTD